MHSTVRVRVREAFKVWPRVAEEGHACVCMRVCVHVSGMGARTACAHFAIGVLSDLAW